MEPVENHNCAGLCAERFCDNVETHFQIFEIHGMQFIIGFCEKHSEGYDFGVSDQVRKKFERVNHGN